MIQPKDIHGARFSQQSASVLKSFEKSYKISEYYFIKVTEMIVQKGISFLRNFFKFSKKTKINKRLVFLNILKFTERKNFFFLSHYIFSPSPGFKKEEKTHLPLPILGTGTYQNSLSELILESTKL